MNNSNTLYTNGSTVVELSHTKCRHYKIRKRGERNSKWVRIRKNTAQHIRQEFQPVFKKEISLSMADMKRLML